MPRSAKLDGQDILGGLRCQVGLEHITVDFAFVIKLNVLSFCVNQSIIIRAKEVGEKNTAERAEAIAEIGEQFNAALFIYDEGVLGDDIALANAIWRRLLMCRPDPDAQKLEMLVRYVRRTLSLLDNMPLNQIVVHNDFKWVPLKD